MKIIELSKKFKKSLNNLKGQEKINVVKKVREIQNSSNIHHYKNLTGNLKKYKRVHVNNSYVILFYNTSQTDEVSEGLGISDSLKDTNLIFFEDYEHHDKIYLKRKLK